MKIFRNPEFKWLFAVVFAVGVVACLIAFAADVKFGFLMLSVCAVFLVILYISAYLRYKKISSLALNIDKILHGDESVPLDKYSEGELAILQSEINKMTVRLREQQQRLINDKVYLSDSIADISHQIRTPLTSMNLLVSFLDDEQMTAERRRQVIHELYDLLSRIDRLITSLLKISKLDAGTVSFKTERIAYKELLEKACSPIAIPIELREQSLSINAEGEFYGDIMWTCEAVLNIVKNCMEHTSDGGNISITASDNALYGEIIISDNGFGISSADLPHIFERFYKGSGSDKGSFGIGLALARMIITAQNGTVKAENNADGGARFIIRFYKGTV